MDFGTLTSTMFILAVISPFLVQLIVQPGWKKEVKVLLSFSLAIGCYVLGQWIDGILVWPIALDDFIAWGTMSYGSQQLSYQVLKNFVPTSIWNDIEQLGSSPAPPVLTVEEVPTDVTDSPDP